MKKKYQVFVSSTYLDLVEERKEVIQALLELDCIPAGMEIFNATDYDQWTLIKNVINECDYFIVIVAGMYGSVSNEGVSFTEMEYRYAMEIGKPIIGFIHSSPGSLPRLRTEVDPAKQIKLESFRELVKKKMCKFWSTAEDLGSVVSRSIIKLQSSHPAVGWVRANELSGENAITILELHKKIENYEIQLAAFATNGLKEAQNFAQEDDPLVIPYILRHYSQYNGPFNDTREYNKEALTTWNQLYSFISPELRRPLSSFQEHITKFILKIDAPSLSKYEDEEDPSSGYEVILDHYDYETISLQLQVLGLIQLLPSGEFQLTSYGENKMKSLRLIKRNETDVGAEYQV
jgi:hypothetical protein